MSSDHGGGGGGGRSNDSGGGGNRRRQNGGGGGGRQQQDGTDVDTKRAAKFERSAEMYAKKNIPGPWLNTPCKGSPYHALLRMIHNGKPKPQSAYPWLNHPVFMLHEQIGAALGVADFLNHERERWRRIEGSKASEADEAEDDAADGGGKKKPPSDAALLEASIREKAYHSGDISWHKIDNNPPKGAPASASPPWYYHMCLMVPLCYLADNAKHLMDFKNDVKSHAVATVVSFFLQAMTNEYVPYNSHGEEMDTTNFRYGANLVPRIRAFLEIVLVEGAGGYEDKLAMDPASKEGVAQYPLPDPAVLHQLHQRKNVVGFRWHFLIFDNQKHPAALFKAQVWRNLWEKHRINIDDLHGLMKDRINNTGFQVYKETKRREEEDAKKPPEPDPEEEEKKRKENVKKLKELSKNRRRQQKEEDPDADELAAEGGAVEESDAEGEEEDDGSSADDEEEEDSQEGADHSSQAEEGDPEEDEASQADRARKVLEDMGGLEPGRAPMEKALERAKAVVDANKGKSKDNSKKKKQSTTVTTTKVRIDAKSQTEYRSSSFAKDTAANKLADESREPTPLSYYRNVLCFPDLSQMVIHKYNELADSPLAREFPHGLYDYSCKDGNGGVLNSVNYDMHTTRSPMHYSHTFNFENSVRVACLHTPDNIGRNKPILAAQADPRRYMVESNGGGGRLNFCFPYPVLAYEMKVIDTRPDFLATFLPPVVISQVRTMLEILRQRISKHSQAVLNKEAHGEDVSKWKNHELEHEGGGSGGGSGGGNGGMHTTNRLEIDQELDDMFDQLVIKPRIQPDLLAEEYWDDKNADEARSEHTRQLQQPNKRTSGGSGGRAAAAAALVWDAHAQGHKFDRFMATGGYCDPVEVHRRATPVNNRRQPAPPPTVNMQDEVVNTAVAMNFALQNNLLTAASASLPSSESMDTSELTEADAHLRKKSRGAIFSDCNDSEMFAMDKATATTKASVLSEADLEARREAARLQQLNIARQELATLLLRQHAWTETERSQINRLADDAVQEEATHGDNNGKLFTVPGTGDKKTLQEMIALAVQQDRAGQDQQLVETIRTILQGTSVADREAIDRYVRRSNIYVDRITKMEYSNAPGAAGSNAHSAKIEAKLESRITDAMAEAEASMSTHVIRGPDAHLRKQLMELKSSIYRTVALFPLKTEIDHLGLWLSRVCQSFVPPSDSREREEAVLEAMTPQREEQYRQDLLSRLIRMHRHEAAVATNGLMDLATPGLSNAHKGLLIYASKRADDKYLSPNFMMDNTLCRFAQMQMYEYTHVQVHCGMTADAGILFTGLLTSFRLLALRHSKPCPQSVLITGPPGVGKSEILKAYTACSVEGQVQDALHQSALSDAVAQANDYVVLAHDEAPSWIVTAVEHMSAGARTERDLRKGMLSGQCIPYARNVDNPATGKRERESVNVSYIHQIIAIANRLENTGENSIFDRFRVQLMLPPAQKGNQPYTHVLTKNLMGRNDTADATSGTFFARQKDQHVIFGMLVTLQNTGALPSTSMELHAIFLSELEKELEQHLSNYRQTNNRKIERSFNDAWAYTFAKVHDRLFCSEASPYIQWDTNQEGKPVGNRIADVIGVHDETALVELVAPALYVDAPTSLWCMTGYFQERFTLRHYEIMLIIAYELFDFSRDFFLPSYQRFGIKLPDVDQRARERGFMDGAYASCSFLQDFAALERKLRENLAQRQLTKANPMPKLAVIRTRQGYGNARAGFNNPAAGGGGGFGKKKTKTDTPDAATREEPEVVEFNPSLLMMEIGVDQFYSLCQHVLTLYYPSIDKEAINYVFGDVRQCHVNAPYYESTNHPTADSLTFHGTISTPDGGWEGKVQYQRVPALAVSKTQVAISTDFLMHCWHEVLYMCLSSVENEHSRRFSTLLPLYYRKFPQLLHRWEHVPNKNHEIRLNNLGQTVSPELLRIMAPDASYIKKMPMGNVSSLQTNVSRPADLVKNHLVHSIETRGDMEMQVFRRHLSNTHCQATSHRDLFNAHPCLTGAHNMVELAAVAADDPRIRHQLFAETHAYAPGALEKLIQWIHSKFPFFEEGRKKYLHYPQDLVNSLQETKLQEKFVCFVESYIREHHWNFSVQKRLGKEQIMHLLELLKKRAQHLRDYEERRKQARYLLHIIFPSSYPQVPPFQLTDHEQRIWRAAAAPGRKDNLAIKSMHRDIAELLTKVEHDEYALMHRLEEWVRPITEQEEEHRTLLEDCQYSVIMGEVMQVYLRKADPSLDAYPDKVAWEHMQSNYQKLHSVGKLEHHVVANMYWHMLWTHTRNEKRRTKQFAVDRYHSQIHYKLRPKVVADGKGGLMSTTTTSAADQAKRRVLEPSLPANAAAPTPMEESSLDEPDPRLRAMVKEKKPSARAILGKNSSKGGGEEEDEQTALARLLAQPTAEDEELAALERARARAAALAAKSFAKASSSKPAAAVPVARPPAPPSVATVPKKPQSRLPPLPPPPDTTFRGTDESYWDDDEEVQVYRT